MWGLFPEIMFLKKALSIKYILMLNDILENRI
jgi:hypothetical protein